MMDLSPDLSQLFSAPTDILWDPDLDIDVGTDELDKARNALAARFAETRDGDDNTVVRVSVDHNAARSQALTRLTDAQSEAVTHGHDPLLILAGAGTGKTKSLTSRISWLIGAGETEPQNILAVTFTRKAAREMRTRLAAILGPIAAAMDIGTFHSIMARMLRDNAKRAGLDPSFVVLDADDSRAIAKDSYQAILAEKSLDLPKKVDYGILTDWLEAETCGTVAPTDGPVAALGLASADQLYAIAQRYRAEKERQKAIDYSDILVMARNLLRDHPGVRRYYNQCWGAVLVDEYQDTNGLQQEWLDLVTDHGRASILTCVGDDDQSVYGWRGARVENILGFAGRYANARIVRLEENFRSTGAILTAANTIIALNEKRHGKTLFTAAASGRRPQAVRYGNSYAEADDIAAKIGRLLKLGVEPTDIAVISRAAMELGQVQMALATSRIPYIVTAGRKFSQMQDIKALTSYLRILLNPADDIAFSFVVQARSRGIGKESLRRYSDQARITGIPLIEVVRQELEGGRMRKNAAEGATALLSFIDQINDDYTLGVSLPEVVEKIRLEAGLDDDIKELREKADAEHDEAKAKSLLRQADASQRRIDDYIATVLAQTDLRSFVDTMSLLETEEEQEHSVWLGTIHAAKGLEFEHVFLVAWEDGVFPSLQAIKDGTQDEETRLAYVAMTRAKTGLTITHCVDRQNRQTHGPNAYLSRLIAEGLVDNLVNS